jgi:hypothetical protein
MDPKICYSGPEIKMAITIFEKTTVITTFCANVAVETA